MSKLAEPLTIRPACAYERDELEDLQRRASLALPEYRAMLEAHPDAIDLPAEQIEDGGVLVAEIDGQMAGFAALVDGDLDGLFVEPKLWRQGIGAALVEAAAHEARRRGYTLTVTANPGARRFYENCGFMFEGDAETRFGPALRMSR